MTNRLRVLGLLIFAVTLYAIQTIGCATSSTAPSRPGQFESQTTVMRTGTPDRVVTYRQPGFSGKVERIGLLPFLKGRDRMNVMDSHNCPISRLSFDPENLAPESVGVLTRHVQEALRKRFGERVIPLGLVTETYDDLSKDEATDTPKLLAKRLGDGLEANFIVVGTVWRYRDRSGSGGGTTNPASVAFAFHLIDVASGKRVWTGKFEETQRSLSEHLLDAPTFFKRGAKWLTASELARYGVQEVFKKFPPQA